MDWSDEAIVLSVRSHGETSAVAELFTRESGRHLGLVRGGKSRRMRPILQAGNIVNAEWRGRLDEHLGSYVLEMINPISSAYFDEPLALSAMQSICAHLSLFPERDLHPHLYDGARFLLFQLEEEDVWPGLLVRFEMEILSELGFRIDVSECVATGVVDDLIYVSPKSGRAVSREAGEPYKDKLLALPSFLLPGSVEEVTTQDLRDGFLLVGYFLQKHIYVARGDDTSEARDRFIRRFNKSQI